MAVINFAPITYAIAKKNNLPFFEIQIDNWGEMVSTAVADGILEYTLPSVPLAGLSIGPASTVSDVYLVQDYSAFTGSLESYDPNIYDVDIDNTQTEQAAGGTNGRLQTIHVPVSADRPFAGFIPQATKIVARNHSRFNLDDDMFWGIDGARHKPSQRSKLDRPVLVLRCWIKDPTPEILYSKRDPNYTSLRRVATAVQAGGNDYIVARIIPIMGRKHVAVSMAALPQSVAPGNGENGAGVEVRASVLRGGAIGNIVGDYPDIPTNELSQLFEQQVFPVIAEGAAPSNLVLTSGSTPMQASFTLDNPGAEWLVLFASHPFDGDAAHLADFAFSVSASD